MIATLQTQLGDLVIRQAMPRDEDSVLGIMRDCAVWLEDSGIDQWKIILTPNFRQVVQDRIKGECAYLASANGEDIGTITIQYADPYSWGDKGKDEQAGYIRGMAVLRKYSGKGIGKAMLDWAEDLIRTKKSAVRLDCMAENYRLCRYYEAIGFNPVGEKTLDNGLKTKLYEKN